VSAVATAPDRGARRSCRTRRRTGRSSSRWRWCERLAAMPWCGRCRAAPDTSLLVNDLLGRSASRSGQLPASPTPRASPASRSHSTPTARTSASSSSRRQLRRGARSGAVVHGAHRPDPAAPPPRKSPGRTMSIFTHAGIGPWLGQRLQIITRTAVTWGYASCTSRIDG